MGKPAQHLVNAIGCRQGDRRLAERSQPRQSVPRRPGRVKKIGKERTKIAAQIEHPGNRRADPFRVVDQEVGEAGHCVKAVGVRQQRRPAISPQRTPRNRACSRADGLGKSERHGVAPQAIGKPSRGLLDIADGPGREITRQLHL